MAFLFDETRAAYFESLTELVANHTSRHSRDAGHWRRLFGEVYVFKKALSGKTIGSIVPDSLWKKIDNPIIFKPLAGDPAHGYEASVLIEVCDALIEGRATLKPGQLFLARQAEIIMRSAAKVGIIALIDEATGFIDDKRERA